MEAGFSWGNLVGLKVVASLYNSYVSNRLTHSKEQGFLCIRCALSVVRGQQYYANSLAGDGLYEDVRFVGVNHISSSGNIYFNWSSDRPWTNYGLTVDSSSKNSSFVDEEFADAKHTIANARISPHATNITYRDNDPAGDATINDCAKAPWVLTGNSGPATVGSDPGTFFLGSGAASRTEAGTSWFLTGPVLICSLKVHVTRAPGVGKSFIITVRHNGIDTRMSGIVVGALHTVSVADASRAFTADASDSIDLKVAVSSRTSGAQFIYSVGFLPQ